VREAEARKQRSIAVLQSEGVPYNPDLPLVDPNGTRSVDEIVGRFCALAVTSFKASTGDHDRAREVLEGMGEHVRLSAAESAFMKDRAPTYHQRAQFSWGIEAAVPLAWSLGWLDELYRPDVCAEANPLLELAYANGVVRIAQARTVRQETDLLDATDLLYRYHWAVRQAGLDGREPPAGLDPGVVMEWHRALNWLTRYCDEDDWDEVTTDT